MLQNNVNVFMGKRCMEESNLGYPVYGDLTYLFNQKYGNVFDEILVLLGYIFEDDIQMYGIDYLLENHKSSLISDLRLQEAQGSNLFYDDVCIKVKGMNGYMHLLSLEPIIFDSLNEVKHQIKYF